MHPRFAVMPGYGRIRAARARMAERPRYPPVVAGVAAALRAIFVLEHAAEPSGRAAHGAPPAGCSGGNAAIRSARWFPRAAASAAAHAAARAASAAAHATSADAGRMGADIRKDHG